MRTLTSRTRRHWPLVAVLAALAVVVVGAIAAAVPNGGGAQLVTSRPDPVSATITDPGTVQSPAKVRFCFDQTINQLTTNPEDDFFLLGYDVGDIRFPENPDAVVIDPNNQSCVQLQFGSSPPSAGGGDVYPHALDLYSIACVRNGEVDGAPAGTPPKLNTPGCVRLDGSTLTPGHGDLAAPNLRSTSVDTVNNRITYTFDRRLDATYCPTGSMGGCEARFGYYDSTGTGAGGVGYHDADLMVSNTGSTSVVLQFNDAGDNVGDAVRFAIVDSAVLSRTQGDQFNGIQHLGGPTTVPDLIQATQVGVNTFELTYDRPINTTMCGAACWVAYTVDGTLYGGTSFSRPGSDATKIRISFSGTQGFNDKIVRIVDPACAAFDLENNACSTLASIGVRAFNITPGFTDGPDLRQVIPEPAGNTVRFRYDQTVSNDPAFFPNINLFVLVDNNGNLSFPVGGAAPAFEGTDVILQFTAAQIAGAVGGGSDICAIRDFEEKGGTDSDCAPAGILGFGDPSALPNGGTSSTGGSTGTGTTTSTSSTGPGSTGSTTTSSTGGSTTTTGTGSTGPGSTTTAGTTTTTSATTTTTSTTSTTSVVTPRTSTSTRARGTCRRSSRGVGCTVSGSVARRGAAARRAFGAQAGCSGRVSVQVKVGRRTVSNRRVRLRSNCRYRSSVRIANRRVRSSRVRIVVRFNGNATLAPSRRTLSVRVR